MEENNIELNKEDVLETLNKPGSSDSEKMTEPVHSESIDPQENEKIKILERVKQKIDIAKQKKAELEALRGQAEIQVEEDEASKENDSSSEKEL